MFQPLSGYKMEYKTTLAFVTDMRTHTCIFSRMSIPRVLFFVVQPNTNAATFAKGFSVMIQISNHWTLSFGHYQNEPGQNDR